MPCLPHRPGLCLVPPHPDLQARWDRLLEAERRRRTDLEPLPAHARKPRRPGLDDGLVVPPFEFPPGLPLSSIRQAAARRVPLRGRVRVAVVLADFEDRPMTAAPDRFRDLFFSSGRMPNGSVAEFYREASGGLVALEGTVAGPYRMPRPLAWYADGSYGIGQAEGGFRSPQLALDAARAASADLGFGRYDNDGDGYVDAYVLVHAGPGAEVTGDRNALWSHKATLDSPLAVDGVQVYAYLTVPEDARTGVCAHELGHLLFGFPDLYDGDYTSEGLGAWCLMAAGSWNGGGDRPCHPSAWCKVAQGWVKVVNVTKEGPLTVREVKASREVYRLWRQGADGPEYFLLENRLRRGFDDGLPGEGLLVWHVDEGQPDNRDETHYKVALLQSDGRRDLERHRNRGDDGDPFPGSGSVRSLDAASSPGTRSYAGQDTGVGLADISDPGPAMTVQVRLGPW